MGFGYNSSRFMGSAIRGFAVRGFGCGVFKVLGFGFGDSWFAVLEVTGFWCGVSGAGFRVLGYAVLGFQGSGFQVRGFDFGLWVSRFGVWLFVVSVSRFRVFEI